MCLAGPGAMGRVMQKRSIKEKSVVANTHLHYYEYKARIPLSLSACNYTGGRAYLLIITVAKCRWRLAKRLYQRTLSRCDDAWPGKVHQRLRLRSLYIHTCTSAPLNWRPATVIPRMTPVRLSPRRRDQELPVDVSVISVRNPRGASTGIPV